MVDSVIRIFLMMVFVTIGIFGIAMVTSDQGLQFDLFTKCVFVISGLVLFLFGIKIGWTRRYH